LPADLGPRLAWFAAVLGDRATADRALAPYATLLWDEPDGSLNRGWPGKPLENSCSQAVSSTASS
jgi:hypothetical protein